MRYDKTTDAYVGTIRLSRQGIWLLVREDEYQLTLTRADLEGVAGDHGDPLDLGPETDGQDDPDALAELRAWDVDPTLVWEQVCTIPASLVREHVPEYLLREMGDPHFAETDG
jgi:hypothetical protein